MINYNSELIMRKNNDRLHTRVIIKRYYPKGLFGIWFKNAKNTFNMGHSAPIKIKTEDWSGSPIVELVNTNKPGDNAVLEIVKAPLSILIDKGPNAASWFMGDTWKATLYSQLANGIGQLICLHYGYTDTKILKITTALVLRYMATGSLLSVYTSPWVLMTDAYQIYKLATWAGPKVKTAYNFATDNFVSSWISWGAKTVWNQFFTKGGAVAKTIQTTSKVTGGDSSSLIIQKADEMTTLKQVIIDNTPKQFTPENLEILNNFKDKLSKENFNILSEQLSYKSTLTDRLAERYINNATQKVNVKDIIGNNNVPLNTNNPKIMGEYANNVKGNDAVNYAQDLLNAQKGIKVDPNINVIQDATETAQQLNWLGKGAVAIATIAAAILLYKGASKIFPNHLPELNFDWLYSVKDVVFGFLYSAKTKVVNLIYSPKPTPNNNSIHEVNEEMKTIVNGKKVTVEDASSSMNDDLNVDADSVSGEENVKIPFSQTNPLPQQLTTYNGHVGVWGVDQYNNPIFLINGVQYPHINQTYYGQHPTNYQPNFGTNVTQEMNTNVSAGSNTNLQPEYIPVNINAKDNPIVMDEYNINPNEIKDGVKEQVVDALNPFNQ